jgi:hypothetical protein
MSTDIFASIEVSHLTNEHDGSLRSLEDHATSRYPEPEQSRQSTSSYLIHLKSISKLYSTAPTLKVTSSGYVITYFPQHFSKENTLLKYTCMQT